MVEAGLQDVMRRLDQQDRSDDDAAHRNADAQRGGNRVPLSNVAEGNEGGAGGRDVMVRSAMPRARAGESSETTRRRATATRTGAIVMASWRVALHAAVRLQRVWRGHVGRATARRALERSSAGGWLHDEGDSDCAVGSHGNIGLERPSIDSLESGCDVHENSALPRDEGREGRGGETMSRSSSAVDTLVSAMALLQGGVSIAGAYEVQRLAATMAVLQGEVRRVNGARER